MIIGITGLIGSGKSTAAEIFKSLGFKIIDADKIARRVVTKDKAVISRLVKAFGTDIITSKKNIRRKYLAKIAFSSNANRQKINNIVHPPVRKEIRELITSYNKKNILLDIPLLLESPFKDIVDYIIMIHATESLRLKRLAQRGIDKKDALARQKQQLPYNTQRKLSDFCIFNNSNKVALKKKCTKVLKEVS